MNNERGEEKDEKDLFFTIKDFDNDTLFKDYFKGLIFKKEQRCKAGIFNSVVHNILSAIQQYTLVELIVLSC